MCEHRAYVINFQLGSFLKNKKMIFNVCKGAVYALITTKFIFLKQLSEKVVLNLKRQNLSWVQPWARPSYAECVGSELNPVFANWGNSDVSSMCLGNLGLGRNKKRKYNANIYGLPTVLTMHFLEVPTHF